MSNALLASVGSTPQPIVLSIETNRPDYAIFFTSKSTRSVVMEHILPALTHRLRDYDILVTPDENDLLASFKALLHGLPPRLEQWGIGFDALEGNYTGGTKTMSAALVLALLRRGSSYAYVGGTERDKDGLGAVKDGHELMIALADPWDLLAIDALRDAAMLFNNHHFQPLAALARSCAARAVGTRPFFTALERVALGFSCWDTFHYVEAVPHLRQAEILFAAMAAINPPPQIREFLAALRATLPTLDVLADAARRLRTPKARTVLPQTDGAEGLALIKDLLANALRRADDGYHYDDAVARLYSAIEKTARLQLLMVHGLDNSNLNPDRIADATVRDKILSACTDARDGTIKLPLHKSFKLLQWLDDPLGTRYAELAEELRKILNVRNMSILAHGLEPVRKETFDTMLGIALQFLDIKREELPRFPVMNWDGLLLDGA